MCSHTCIAFGVHSLKEIDVKDKTILEVGSCSMNGSLRENIVKLNPKKYIGIDISEGPCVDMVCKSEDIVKTFGEESFDVVVSTEMLEHVEDWQSAISNMKNVCKKGGIILITTRSIGFAKHCCPIDCWRYQVEDMKEIFSDFNTEIIRSDYKQRSPGVFVKVIKPLDFKEKDLSNYKLYRVP